LYLCIQRLFFPFVLFRSTNAIIHTFCFMFHVRRLITQSLNLSKINLKQCAYRHLATNNKPFNTGNNELAIRPTTSPTVLANQSTESKNLNNNNSSSFAINISDSCVKRLKELKESDSNQFLRVLVDSGGCSGLEYKFSLDTNISKEDE
jgi:hypothetical protein